MIKTSWADMISGKEGSYSWGLDADGNFYSRKLVYPENKKSEVSFISEIKKVIFNDPATIVFWSDGTKTIVKCTEDDVFDAEKGLSMAICKKAFGNKGSYYNHIKKWTKEYEDDKNHVGKVIEDIMANFNRHSKGFHFGNV